jgi:membrane protein DedA with SNARE-associated domain
VVFWGRIIPGVRTLVSLPAGIEMMPQPLFLIWTTAGSFIWILLLTLAGKTLGAGYAGVSAALKPFTSVLVGILFGAVVCGLLWLLLKWTLKKFRWRS